MFKRYAIASVLLTLLASTVTGAQANDDYDGYSDDGFYDYARVVDARPVYRIVQVSTPNRECWDEQRVHHSRGYDGSAAPTIMGGLLGGVVGSRFGGGKGKDVATVAGVLLGASLANDMRRSRDHGGSYVTTEQVCKNVNLYSEREELDGYQVSYRYKGKTYSTRMSHNPGKKIRVHVQVTPVD